MLMPPRPMTSEIRYPANLVPAGMSQLTFVLTGVAPDARETGRCFDDNPVSTPRSTRPGSKRRPPSSCGRAPSRSDADEPRGRDGLAATMRRALNGAPGPAQVLSPTGIYSVAHLRAVAC